MPSSKHSLKILKKKPLAKKQWKAAPSKPSATSTKKTKPSRAVVSAITPVADVLNFLAEKYADAHCALIHANPFELLVATALSAQCTDVAVNKATPGLFTRFPTPAALGAGELSEIEGLIGTLNLFRTKAKNIKALSTMLVDKHGGVVPRTIEELIEFPGVGRKTANVVLGNAFGLASGVVVDTHVARLCYRFGWTKSDKPVEIERELQKLIPKARWVQIAHELIFHGRQICAARGPRCGECSLSTICARVGVEEVRA